jgi:hypothetical protein
MAVVSAVVLAVASAVVSAVAGVYYILTITIIMACLSVSVVVLQLNIF